MGFHRDDDAMGVLESAEQMSVDAGPLSGYRIIDLTSYVSGPFATMLLADQGAEVIKIEEPNTGDFLRYSGTSRENLAAPFLTNNRNKLSVALDLKRPEALEVVYRLVETADVFVQNFRPGVADRLGVGEAVLRGKNKNLIYVSISGFGPSGPYAARRVYDSVVQSVGGIGHLQKGSRDRPELVRTVMADKVTAQYAAQGITAALLARERGKGGQHVEVPMLDATLAWIWPDGMTDLTFVGDENVVRAARVAELDLIFATQDGHIMVASVSDAEFVAFAEGLGQPELAQDGRFRTIQGRLTHWKALADIIRKELVKHKTDYWDARFAEADAVSAPVNSREQVVADPQVIESEILFEYQHSAAGTIRQPRHPIRFSATPADSARSEAPVLGEHTKAILQALDLSDGEIEQITG